MNNNFRESKLVFFGFEGGQADKFVPKIQAAEKKVQEEKEKTKPESGKADIVDESKVKDKIEGIEKKIKESPVSDKYKEQIEKSLITLLDKKEKDLKRVDAKKEDKLKALFDKILVDLDEFKDQPEVKDIYETIEPFFKNKDKIKPVINLKTYRRGSGHWKEINANLEKKAGITKKQIDSIQKILKVKKDGKVGPETINALAAMLDEKVSVKFDDKETFYEGESKSVEQKQAELGQIPEEDKDETDGKKVEEKPKEKASKPAPAVVSLPAKTEQKPEKVAEPAKAPKLAIEKPEKVAEPAKAQEPAIEKPAEVIVSKPLPGNLEGKGFSFDSAGNLKNPAYPGVFKILREPRSRLIEAGGIIHTTPDGIQRYLRPGGDPNSEWKTYHYQSISDQSIVENRKALGLPEKLILSSENIASSVDRYPNLKGKGFYQVGDKLLRHGNPGTYAIGQDGSVTYTWPNGGKSKLAPGADPDKGWESIDEKGKEAVTKRMFEKTLESKGFYYSEDGKLRREGYKGFYTIQPDQRIVYTWPNGGKSQLVGSRDPAGNLADDKWKPLDDKAGEALAHSIEEKEIQVNIGPGEYVSLERARELGFAKPSKISDAEVMINQFTQGQKQDMLKALLEGKELSDLQKMRLQQIGILKTALQALRTDIKTSRTWAEWDRQVNEFEGTTNARLLWVDNKIQELDQVAAKVLEDPNVTIGQLVDGGTKRFLLDHKLNETAPYLMDAQGRIKEANSLGELQGQYFGLVQFLRDKKDYASAQNLIEENLLGPQFAAKRKELTQKEQNKAKSEATAKIYKMASAYAEEWTKQGMSPEQQSGYIQALIGEETKRGLNKAVAEINKGLPFDKETGWNKAIMESYKDMMGTGEWYNLSDSTWDTIIEETLINAPLIIASGGVASLARAGITAGARSLIAAARLTRFGIAATRVAEGIEATGALSKALYWGGNKLGSAAGLLVEGAAFETVYSGLHGENLFEGGWEKFPQWGKRILWSSASLGAFHIAGDMANKVNNVVLKYVTKFPDKSVGAAIQKLITTGSSETAAMLGIGAVQHYMENGNLKDFDFSNELFHALISVGALKVSGGALEVGKKRFFPGPESALGEMSTADREANAKLREEAAKKIEEDYRKSDIKTGDEVTLKSENGTEETGWKVEANAPNGQVIVSKIIDGKFKSKYVDKAKILADNANGPSKKAEVKIVPPSEPNKFLEWAKEQIKAITDIELRKNIGEVLSDLSKSIQSLSKGGLTALNNKWKSISEDVGKFSKELKKEIDENIEKKNESEKSEEKAKEAEKIRDGDEIYILRSNGVIERGWKVMGQTEQGMSVYSETLQARRFVTHNEVWRIETVEARSTVDHLGLVSGQEVYVRRSNGGIERGWVVDTVNPDGTYKLRNKDNNQLTRTSLADEIFAIKDLEETTYKKQLDSGNDLTAEIPQDISGARDIKDIYNILDAGSEKFEGYEVKKLKKAIKEYVDRNGEISPEKITKKGGLRDKIIELVELKKMQDIAKQISSKKVSVDVRVKGPVKIEAASQQEIDGAIRKWEGAQSADHSWGAIVERGHADHFRRSSPTKLEINFQNGSTIKLLFPKKMEAKMKSLQADVVKMEQWIQAKFGENGIQPNKTLTILMMEDSIGLKQIRGHAGSTNILLNAGDVAKGQEFFDTYLHERTHSILGQEGLNPVNNGVIEGIANHIAAEGVSRLNLGTPEILKQSAAREKVSREILKLVKQGKSFEEAFNEYFQNHHNDADHSLNYEYGQAFTEAVIKHFNGDMRPFLKLYAELGSYNYRGLKVAELYARAMDRSGISDHDIREIFKLTSATVMLKAYRGHELLDLLIHENVDNIEATLREQKLETIFGLTSATLNELNNHVAEAKRYLLSSSNIFNKTNAAKIIQILDAKLISLKVQKGSSGQTVMF